MLRFMSSVPALFLGVALLVSGSFLLGTQVAVRLSVEGFSAGSIGFILVCYSFGFVIGTQYGVPVIQQVGHVRSFAAFAAIACASILLYPLVISGPVWSVLRFILGISMAGLTITIESWINGRATNSNRGRLLSIYMVTYYLAAALGELLVGAGPPGASSLFNVAAILVVLSLVPVTLTGVAAPVLTQAPRLTLRQLYAISPTGLTGALAAGVVSSAFLSVGPVYARLSGLSVRQLSLYMAVSVLTAMLLQWPAGRLSDIYDRRRALSVLAALAALFSVSVAAFGSLSVVALFVLTALFMGVAASLYPVSVALTNDFMASDQVVAASSGLLFSYGIGSCFGPLAGSLLMQWFGPGSLFLFMGGVLVMIAVYGGYRSVYTPDVPLEDQCDYVPVSAHSSHVITELDPRNPDFVPDSEGVYESVSPNESGTAAHVAATDEPVGGDHGPTAEKTSTVVEHA